MTLASALHSGSSPRTSRSSAPRPRARLTAPAGLRRFLQARVLTAGLDSALAAGANPADSPAWTARATYLSNPGSRARVASGLAVAIERASFVRPALSAAIPVQRTQIRDAQHDLGALIVALRDPRPVRAQGVALARRLLVDGSGPLYAHAPAGTLRAAAWTAAGPPA